MTNSINAYPLGWQIFAYTVLGIGLFFVTGFLTRYTLKLPWTQTEEGKHLVAVASNIGAFFVLYIALSIWPEFPGRGAVRLALLLGIVANMGWRWLLLEKHLRRLDRIKEDS